jgi:hypothetical protein
LYLIIGLVMLCIASLTVHAVEYQQEIKDYEKIDTPNIIKHQQVLDISTKDKKQQEDIEEHEAIKPYNIMDGKHNVEDPFIRSEKNILFDNKRALIESEKILDEEYAASLRKYKYYLNLYFIGDLLIKGAASLNTTLNNISINDEIVDIRTYDSFSAISLSVGTVHHLTKYDNLVTSHRTYLNYVTSYGDSNKQYELNIATLEYDYMLSLDNNSLLLGFFIGQSNLVWTQNINAQFDLQDKEISGGIIGINIGAAYQFVNTKMQQTSLEYGFKYLLSNHAVNLTRADNVPFYHDKQNLEIIINNISYLYLGLSTTF